MLLELRGLQKRFGGVHALKKGDLCVEAGEVAVAAIDGEWPDLRRAFVQWLDAANFDAEGQQRVALSALTAGISRPARPSLTDP